MKNKYLLLKTTFKINNFNTILEKDLIYMMRNAALIKDGKKEQFEQEFLSLLQSKNWNWFIKDIDDCTILLYSIYTNSNVILNYLIDNDFYSIREHNLVVQNAINSANRMINFDMLDKIFSYSELNTKYKDNAILDLFLYAFQCSDTVYNKRVNKAFSLLDEIDNKKNLFVEVLESLLKNNRINDSTRIINWLEEYPLFINDKIEITNQIYNKISNYEDKSSLLFFNDEKSSSIKFLLDKWKSYYSLNIKLSEKSLNKTHKI